MRGPGALYRGGRHRSVHPTSHASDNWRVATPSHYELLYSSHMQDQDPACSSHPAKKKRTEDHPLPADAGQKPIQLQRRRVWRACECCRRKKIKCDGNEPVCSQCKASKTQCTWLQTKDRAALSRHYVQELEARLLHMEEVFKQVAPVVELLGKSPQGVLLSKALSETGQEGDAEDQHSISHIPAPESSALDEASNQITPTIEDHSDEDASTTFGQLALDEHGHLRWIGGSSTMSLIQSFRALTTSPLSRVSPMEEDPNSPNPNANKLYFPASVYFGKVDALPGAEEVEFPDREFADKMVDTFFRRFHYLLPAIDKPSFLNAYRHLMDNIADISLIRSQTAFIALVFAVFACAARIVDERIDSTRDDGGLGMVYYERALILHYISHASIQIAHVQCFVLLSSFLCSVNCLPQAWLLVGQAVRMAQDLGLHRYSRHLAISALEKENRKKVWWCVYSLDRMLALALGRPLGVEDSDCDAELPADVDDEDLQEYFSGAQMQRSQPSMMTGFIALVELYKIAGRVCRRVYAIDKCKDNLEHDKMAELLGSVAVLDKELTKWCEDLPVAFKSHPTNESQVSMGAVLCSHYYSILTTLHRNFLPIKKNAFGAMSTASTAKALSSARSCIRLAPSIKNVVAPSHHLAFFIQNLFSSAVILLLYAMHITDIKAARAAMEEAESCIERVGAWEGSWPGARKCKELLSDLTATARAAVANGTAAARREQQSHKSRSRSSTASPLSSPAAATSHAGRAIKGKPSRTRTPSSRRKSRDSNPSPRQAHETVNHGSPSYSPTSAILPPHKRTHGEMDHMPSFGTNAVSLQSNFSTYANNPNNNGTFREPSSSTLVASQFIPNIKSSTSPTLVPTNMYDSPVPPSALSQASPAMGYGYSYGNANSGPPETTWESAQENSNADIFSPNSDAVFHYQQNAQGNVDSHFVPFDSGMAMQTQPEGTPPSSSFATPGLPFPGLDFIRNYTPGGYVEDGQEALWRSFDAGEFRYDPELPFTLGELPPDGRS